MRFVKFTRHVRSYTLALIAGMALAGVATAQQPQPMTPKDRPITRVPRNEPQPQQPTPQSGTSDERNRDSNVQAQVQPPPGIPHERYRLWLGVETDTLDIGERIRNVRRGTAAEQAGLEAGDIIIAVAGYQVGKVEGRTYPVEDEVKRRASPDGRVRLLVQNVRNNQLQNVDVQLDRRGTGGGAGQWDGGGPINPQRDLLVVEAMYRDRRAWPRDAEVRARIVELGMFSRPTVAEQSYRNLQGSPLRFEMWYPTQQFKPGTQLELRVEVWDGDDRWMVGDRVKFNVGQAQPVRVDLRPA